MDSYLVFSFRGQDVISVPADSVELTRAGIELYVPSSWRRALYKAAMRLAHWVRAEGALATRSSTPVRSHPEFDFALWLGQVREAIAVGDARAVVRFPSQPHRGRFYVYLVSKRGEPLAFVKVSLDAENDRRLATEAEAIREMMQQPPRTFRVPRLLDVGSFESHLYLITEAIPCEARAARSRWAPIPQRCKNEIAERSSRIRVVKDLSWWDKFVKESQGVRSLAAEVARESDRQIQVCRAHGDFKNTNIIVAGDQVWIVDWEDSSPDAPVGCDEISFFLGSRVRAITSNPRAVAAALGRRLSVEWDGRDAALAMAFLCTTGNEAHMLCAQHWDNVIQGAPGKCQPATGNGL